MQSSDLKKPILYSSGGLPFNSLGGNGARFRASEQAKITAPWKNLVKKKEDKLKL
jgi:hypothetical protein